MPDYFSDRENGPRARTEQVISPTVWAGVVAARPSAVAPPLTEIFISRLPP